jgi:choice-of-anchor A domain-containing protein
MRKSTTAMMALIATVGGGAVAAHAANITDPNILPILIADYNAIVDGQFNSTSDTEGPVLIGGDLGPGPVALNQNDVMLGTTTGTTAITGFGEVNVFGNQTALFNSAMGHVLVGGSISSNNPPFLGATSVASHYAFPPGATAADNAATFQNNIWSKITGFSSSLASRTENSTFTPMGEFMPGASVGAGIPAVFDVTLAQLQALGSSTILSFAGCLAATAATPCDAVINVTGSGTLNQAFLYGFTKAQPNLIWNFENATDLEINNQWGASILAPDALVHTTAPINGNVIAATFGGTAPIGSGELHLPTFDCGDQLCDAPPVPEPGSLPLLGGALGLMMVVTVLGAWRRTRLDLV